ncbi:MAG: pectate lyase [Thalassobius sp.]|nr:pectate lyase [Thalassovita sp.]
MKVIWLLVFFLKFSCNIPVVNPPEKAIAFPGAEGYGKYASGGRGGNVWIVSNLNDSGPGSFREAIQAKGARIITFAISGNIQLKSRLEIKNDNITIAGQTAPGDGICIRDYPMVIKANNVIIRYMRFRLGDVSKIEDDAFKANKVDNVIVDHCSVSWSTDECASFYDNTNFTMQWSIISESLNKSVHSKGEHGYGGIWGGMGATFHHNLLAHHQSRNPRFQGARYHKKPEAELSDFRNNVIYNWRSNSSYGGEEGNYNLINNYYKSGPATKKSVSRRILNPFEPYGNFYLEGNFMENYPNVSANNWEGVDCNEPTEAKASTEFNTIDIDFQSATEAYNLVLAYSGCSLKRDEIDKRIIEEVTNGTAHYGELKDGIINSQDEVGAWPKLASQPALIDTDHDGMPDNWEKENGLDKSDAADASQYTLSENYTNVEEYLNSIVNPIP